MKIALIGNDYVQQFPLENYGGIESCVENLAQGLYARKQDFFVVCPKRKIQVDYPFEIYETEEEPSSITKKNSFYYSYSVAKTLKNLNFDIIWSQSHWSIEPLLEFKKPIICTFHDSCDKQSGWMKKNNNIKYRFLSKFQFNNWVKEDWEEQNSFQCYLGLGDLDFQLNEKKEEYFLWCGGLNWGLEGKGLDLFIELAKQNKNKNFVAYGSGNDELEKYLKNINLSNFLFKGKLSRGSEHINVFKNAKALIMPTKIMDTFPRVCLEAASKGTPTIGSKNGSLPEIINFCGGTLCDSIQEYSNALDIEYDYKTIFYKSKQFSINNEINNLIQKSK